MRKQGSGDSSYGRAIVVDARDFVDGYTVMMKNGGLRVTIRVLATLKDWKSKMRRFLFEGRHDGWTLMSFMVTIHSDMRIGLKGRIVGLNPI